MTFCSELFDTSFVSVDVHDKISVAIESMEAQQCKHLPVLEGNIFLGMIAEDDLLDADADEEIITLKRFFINAFVRSTDYFMLALKVRSKFNIDFIPVLNEKNELEGLVGIGKMLDQISNVTGISDQGSLLVLEVNRFDYALGEINRLVESNDANIMHLNTVQDPVTEQMQIILRINKEEISDVVSIFQRHEYQVLYYYGEETYSNSLQDNLDHLINYLNI
jgi:predicted transcriptional regulator